MNDAFVFAGVNPKNCVLLLANGAPPDFHLFAQYLSCAHALVAVDGGANWALKHGFKPDVIIGDLDSLEDSHRGLASVRHNRCQETNDLEKALAFCLDKSWLRLVVLGALGGRLDHILTNLAAVARFDSRLEIILADETQAAFMCPVQRSVELSGLNGSFLSLFPMDTEVGPVNLSGADYSFSDMIMSPQGKLGTLNRINSDVARLYCESGRLLVMLPNR